MLRNCHQVTNDLIVLAVLKLTERRVTRNMAHIQDANFAVYCHLADDSSSCPSCKS